MKRFPEHIPRILPPALSRTYTIRSCLKYTKQSATYLLSTRASAQEYLLKTAVPSVYSDMLANEKKILEHIHRSSDSVFACAFPLPVYLAVHRGITYYIRTYIPGQTLEDLCEINYTRPGIDPDLALEYVISLTRLLQFMHSMEPPLIHRDIKPQNVVIDPDGGCHFIDLGISQLYRTELSHRRIQGNGCNPRRAWAASGTYHPESDASLPKGALSERRRASGCASKRPYLI